MLATLGLALCNEGNKPTFVRGASETHLNLTLVTQGAASRVTGWKILDKEALSLHKYIVFNINANIGQQKAVTKKGWAYRKINYHKLTEKIRLGVPLPTNNAVSA